MRKQNSLGCVCTRSNTPTVTRSRIWYQLLLAAVAVLLISPAFGHRLALAQDATGDITRDEINEVASELYCPLCSGVRLDSCELQACDQMREEIALRLQSGDDKESIKAYFLQQYGPQVLGEPPRDSLLNWLAWILPFAAVGVGGLWLLLRARQIGRRQSAPAVDSVSSAHAAVGANGAIPPPSPRDDEYDKKLDEELRRYE